MPRTEAPVAAVAAEAALAPVPALARAAAEPVAARRTLMPQRIKNKICIKKRKIMPNFLLRTLGNIF